MKYINCNKRSGKAVNFLFDYTLLCIELKLHLDDHNQVNHTWDDQLEFCDSVGNPEDDKWPEITVTNSVRANKVAKAKDTISKRKKRKLGKRESFAPTPADKLPHQSSN